jgi:hypothetical protein
MALNKTWKSMCKLLAHLFKSTVLPPVNTRNSTLTIVDSAHAMMCGLGALFVRSNDAWFSGTEPMKAAVGRWDHGRTRELYRQVATNIYKTKDGRWFSLHGNMDPTPLLTMLNVPQHNEKNRSWPEILQMYMDIVAQHDSKTLDDWSNNIYRVPGTICYEEDEFLATPHVC